jgi:hypothetical protein
VNSGGNKVKYLLLTAVIILSVFLIYGLHYRDYVKCNGCISELYPYPIHGDEWTHLAQAIYMMDAGTLPNINPYLGTPHVNLESGFHAFLAQLFTLTGLDPVLNYQFLPAIFTILILLILTLFVYNLTKNFYIGIISSVFLLSIRENINITGLWFFVPFILGVFLLFFFFYTYFDKEIRNLSIIFYIVSMFVYPVITFVITAALFILFLLDNNFNFNNIKNYWPYIFLMALSFIIVLFYFKLDFGAVLYSLTFKYGWTTGFEVNYSLMELYGLAGIISALIGVYVIIKQKLNKILIILPALILIPVIMYNTVQYTVFLPFQRAIVLLLMLLAPLSGIGLYAVMSKIYYMLHKKFISISIIILLSVLFLIVSFYNYHVVTEQTFEPSHLVTTYDYDALMYMRYAHINGKIMAPWDVSFGVYPISKNTLMALVPSNLGEGDTAPIFMFYYSNCLLKRDILTNNSITFVYSRFPLNCKFLKPIYSNNSYIYEKI